MYMWSVWSAGMATLPTWDWSDIRVPCTEELRNDVYDLYLSVLLVGMLELSKKAKRKSSITSKLQPSLAEVRFHTHVLLPKSSVQLVCTKPSASVRPVCTSLRNCRASEDEEHHASSGNREVLKKIIMEEGGGGSHPARLWSTRYEGSTNRVWRIGCVPIMRKCRHSLGGGCQLQKLSMTSWAYKLSCIRCKKGKIFTSCEMSSSTALDFTC